MKILLKIFLAVIAVLFLLTGGAAIYLTRGLESGARLDIDGIDLSGAEDGIYVGAYDSGRFSNKVGVTIKDHKIVDIKLIKDVAFSKPEIAETIFDRVIEKQDVAVDTVSGATVTCKAYLKAVENALKDAG